MSFIKSRLNRDNFWNLMFWLGVTLCVMLSEYFNDNKLFAGLSLWLGILGVPFIVKQMQDVKFDKKYGFFNASGRSLKDSMPMRWGFSIISSIGLIAIMRLINDKFSSDPNTSLSMVLYWSIFCLIPTLYFIYKNCPISILFNRKLWSYIAANAPMPTRRRNDYQGSHKTLLDNKFISPRFYYLPYNIYHRKK